MDMKKLRFDLEQLIGKNIWLSITTRKFTDEDVTEARYAGQLAGYAPGVGDSILIVFIGGFSATVNPTDVSAKVDTLR
ncbi:hypothetical protein [Leifsonia sp. Leaf264]|uniref:hypothetical protein n=1 Tax=Leifsonia sp. Leaf264 TaxID=1736314 RepID=UPI0006FACB7D|nr:hypothetical protein [Leifsonia sp. Leaf264]KQO98473.1 hypothetical protein ASF30_10450 [Leifsonia sp. Leaf264]